jgi:DNA-binding response OmpR family regulator
MPSILIVEDERAIASFLERGFRSSGFSPTVVADGADAVAFARTGEFDIVLLDLGLPDVDGLSVLQRLREKNRSLPVVILTARSGVEHTVAGFEGGADDYVTKPFKFEELLARVRARLRSDRGPESSVLTVGDCALDLRTRRVKVRGSVVELSAREFALAELFFTHPGQVLTREQLLSRVWGYDHDPGSNVVDVYVGYLRKKLGPERIQTVRGMGYRLEPGANGGAGVDSPSEQR